MPIINSSALGGLRCQEEGQAKLALCQLFVPLRVCVGLSPMGVGGPLTLTASRAFISIHSCIEATRSPSSVDRGVVFAD